MRLRAWPLAISLCVLFLTQQGCSLFSDDETPDADTETAAHSGSALRVGLPELENFMEAEKAYDADRFGIAKNFYDKILQEYPASPLTSLAEIKSADSLFYMRRFPEAVESYRTFIQVHPTHEASAYCQYQIAEAYFESYEGPTKDETPLREARKEFLVLIDKYPQSPYAVRGRIEVLRIDEKLLSSEKEKIVFYKKMGDDKAALARTEEVEAIYAHLGDIPEFIESEYASFNEFQENTREDIEAFEALDAPQMVQVTEDPTRQLATTARGETAQPSLMTSQIPSAPESEADVKTLSLARREDTSETPAEKGPVGRLSDNFTAQAPTADSAEVPQEQKAIAESEPLADDLTNAVATSNMTPSELDEAGPKDTYKQAPSHEMTNDKTEDDSHFIQSLSCSKNENGVSISFELHRKTFLKSSRLIQPVFQPENASALAGEKKVIVSFLDRLHLTPLTEDYFSLQNGWALAQHKECSTDKLKIRITERLRTFESASEQEVEWEPKASLTLTAHGTSLAAPIISLDSSQKKGTVLFTIAGK